jgi:hypothetical protein
VKVRNFKICVINDNFYSRADIITDAHQSALSPAKRQKLAARKLMIFFIPGFSTGLMLYIRSEEHHDFF